jgi:opacity protein-like surface antigen
MSRWWLAGAALSFLTGTASAQTSGSYVNADTPALPSQVATLAQLDITQTASLESHNTFGSVYGYDLGNGFKTEIQGLTARSSTERLTNLPAGGSGFAATSFMLKGMYEFSEGAWHMSPYVGAGFGAVNANAGVLGATRNEWLGSYQVGGGLNLGFTQKLMGSLEYRWTMGSKPRFLLAGIPTKLEVNRHGFVLGVNYKY